MNREVLRKLRGGDLRSLGRSGDIAPEIANDPKRFAQAFAALLSADPVVRSRAADAVEKATRERPALLHPHKTVLLKRIALIEQQEVRWHVAQMLPRLELTAKERDSAIAVLFEYLEDKSSIVRTMAMQALADFAVRDERLRKRIVPVLEFLTKEGTPAMRARGRRLLRQLSLH